MPRNASWIRSEKRRAFYARDDYLCLYCRCEVAIYPAPMRKGECYPNDGATLDHLQPPRRGGTNDVPNIVTACKRCNNEKNGKTLGEYLRYLYRDDEQREAERKRIRRQAGRSVKKIIAELRLDALVASKVEDRIQEMIAQGLLADLREEDVPF